MRLPLYPLLFKSIKTAHYTINATLLRKIIQEHSLKGSLIQEAHTRIEAVYRFLTDTSPTQEQRELAKNILKKWDPRGTKIPELKHLAANEWRVELKKIENLKRNFTLWCEKVSKASEAHITRQDHTIFRAQIAFSLTRLDLLAINPTPCYLKHLWPLAGNADEKRLNVGDIGDLLARKKGWSTRVMFSIALSVFLFSWIFYKVMDNYHVHEEGASGPGYYQPEVRQDHYRYMLADYTRIKDELALFEGERREVLGRKASLLLSIDEAERNLRRQLESTDSEVLLLPNLSELFMRFYSNQAFMRFFYVEEFDAVEKYKRLQSEWLPANGGSITEKDFNAHWPYNDVPLNLSRSTLLEQIGLADCAEESIYDIDWKVYIPHRSTEGFVVGRKYTVEVISHTLSLDSCYGLYIEFGTMPNMNDVRRFYLYNVTDPVLIGKPFYNITWKVEDYIKDYLRTKNKSEFRAALESLFTSNNEYVSLKQTWRKYALDNPLIVHEYGVFKASILIAEDEIHHLETERLRLDMELRKRKKFLESIRDELSLREKKCLLAGQDICL